MQAGGQTGGRRGGLRLDPFSVSLLLVLLFFLLFVRTPAVARPRLRSVYVYDPSRLYCAQSGRRAGGGPRGAFLIFSVAVSAALSSFLRLGLALALRVRPLRPPQWVDARAAWHSLRAALRWASALGGNGSCDHARVVVPFVCRAFQPCKDAPDGGGRTTNAARAAWLLLCCCLPAFPPAGRDISLVSVFFSFRLGPFCRCRRCAFRCSPLVRRRRADGLEAVCTAQRPYCDRCTLHLWRSLASPHRPDPRPPLHPTPPSPSSLA